MARINSRFYHGILTNHSEDVVAVFFQEPSPEFHQLYAKENINQILDNIPVNISQLVPGLRVLVESKPNFAVLGTVMGEYENKNSNISRNNKDSYSNASINNSNKNNSYSNATINNNSKNGAQLVLMNLTIRLDESGQDISVADKTIWFLPVQTKDRGN